MILKNIFAREILVVVEITLAFYFKKYHLRCEKQCFLLIFIYLTNVEFDIVHILCVVQNLIFSSVSLFRHNFRVLKLT